MAKHTLKILSCSHRKSFNVSLAIFQHYECLSPFHTDPLPYLNVSDGKHEYKWEPWDEMG